MIYISIPQFSNRKINGIVSRTHACLVSLDNDHPVCLMHRKQTKISQPVFSQYHTIIFSFTISLILVRCISQFA